MLAGFLLKGFLVGIVIAVPTGPVGVLCIRRTIFFGRLAGLMSGMGAATADTIFGIIAGFGLTVVSDWLLGYQEWLRLGGALFLLYLGTSVLFTEPEVRPPTGLDPNLLRFYASTFALTITNPITILAFLAIFAAMGFTGREAGLSAVAVLVLGVLLGSLLWWVGLSVGAGSFRDAFDKRHLRWLNRGSGGILLLSGVMLIGSSLMAYFD
ncbi:MAG: LysE family transporter [Alphaproteobacteria bacterium]|nr:LysE family transporter [Alphaproteobacteria bacterium]